MRTADVLRGIKGLSWLLWLELAVLPVISKFDVAINLLVKQVFLNFSGPKGMARLGVLKTDYVFSKHETPQEK